MGAPVWRFRASLALFAFAGCCVYGGQIRLICATAWIAAPLYSYVYRQRDLPTSFVAPTISSSRHLCFAPVVADIPDGGLSPDLDAPGVEPCVQNLRFGGEFPSGLSAIVWGSLGMLVSPRAPRTASDCPSSGVSRRSDIVTNAITGRLKTESSSYPALRRLPPYVAFFSASVLSLTAELAGPTSVLAIRDHFESIHLSGQAAPRTARPAIAAFKYATCARWHLEHPPIVSAASVGFHSHPKRAPSSPSTIQRSFDKIAPPLWLHLVGSYSHRRFYPWRAPRFDM